jgi:hypothetical protein
LIEHIAVQIRVSRFETKRILAHEPPIRRTVISGIELVVARIRIISPTRVQEARRIGRVRLGDETAIRIVGDRILHATAGADYLPNRINIIRQEPLRCAVGVHLAVELVQAGRTHQSHKSLSDND